MRNLQTLLRTSLFRALRFLFRLVPMREPTRDRWRAMFIDRFSTLIPSAPRGRVGDAILGRRPRAHTAGHAIGHVQRRQEPLLEPLPARLIAFYLPQFHPVPENDAWWGQGFTEWNNVVRALPQFEGHAQPRLPSDLGFYDLRDKSVMREQAQLARSYGIEGFCFYFYWFAGKTLLETPLAGWLSDAGMDLPACICWANENWTRTWDGRRDDVLIGQRHSAEDDLAFIAHVAPYLADPRYIRVDGKPLLLVYRPTLLHDARATADRWRQWCRDNGVGEILLAYVQSFERPDPGEIGFDAAVEFPPNLSSADDLTARQSLLNPRYAGHALDWRRLASDYENRPQPTYRFFPGVNCGWDNEPRRPGQGRTYLHASPRRYRDWLRHTVVHRLADRDASDRLVFINAWNEWAEGAVLEPDVRLGHAWLQATRDALCTEPGGRAGPAPRPCAVIHAWYADVFKEMLLTLRESRHDWRIVVTTSHDKAEQMRSVVVDVGMAADIEVSDNCGRDILPFLRVANRLLDEGEDVVLKLHTKKSPHRTDGDRWRMEITSALASPERVAHTIEAFRTSPTLGMVVANGHLQPMTHFWGHNQENVDYLVTRLGLGAIDVGRQTFAPGSMFWARLEALRPILDAHLDEWEFEPEAAQVDGTMAHAVERVFTVAAAFAGFEVMESPAGGNGAQPARTPTPFGFAERDPGA